MSPPEPFESDDAQNTRGAMAGECDRDGNQRAAEAVTGSQIAHEPRSLDPPASAALRSTTSMPRGFSPFLDSLSFQITYERGHTYLDRCGQTLVDIERECPGWIAGDPTPSSGVVINTATQQQITFDVRSFAFVARRPSQPEAAFAEGLKLWDIVRTNLGLSYAVRIGCRFQYLMAVPSLEEANKQIARSPFTVQVPKDLSGYTATVRQPTVVLKSEDGFEVRLAWQGIRRSEGYSPPAITAAEPRTLPRHHRAAAEEVLKAKLQYSRNPFFAVQLDMDFVVYDVDQISSKALKPVLGEFQTTALSDFFPLIARLA